MYRHSDRYPLYYQVYNVVGDYMASVDQTQQAVSYWRKALSLEIPRMGEREDIQNKISKYDKE